MKIFKNLLAMFVLVLGMTFANDLSAQGVDWKERTEAVDELSRLRSDLQGTTSYTKQEVSALHRAYYDVINSLDEAEDTERGYDNWVTYVDQEAAENDPNGDYANEVQRLKDHIYGIVTE